MVPHRLVLRSPVRKEVSAVETPDPARVGNGFVVDPVVGAPDERAQNGIHWLPVAGGAEIEGADADTGEAFVFGEGLMQIAPLRREQKLVEIDEGDPAGIIGESVHAMTVSGDLAGVCWPVGERDDAAPSVRLNDLTRIVVAAVVVEIEVIDAHGEMKWQPFAQHDGFVAEDRADAEVVVSACGEAPVAQAGAEFVGEANPAPNQSAHVPGRLLLDFRDLWRCTMLNPSDKCASLLIMIANIEFGPQD